MSCSRGSRSSGREYLRIIYGPEYTRPENLARLRGRFLNHKRSLAIREYALGLEALDRLAEGEPLWRVHEAVFAVLALLMDGTVALVASRARDWFASSPQRMSRVGGAGGLMMVGLGTGLALSGRPE